MTKPLQDGITIETIWLDQDMIEVLVSVSNGYFSGIAEIYVGYHELPHMAKALRGYPSSSEDVRRAALGTFDTTYSDGAIAMEFYCRDLQGHCMVKVRLKGGAYRGSDLETVLLYIPIEPAGIDAFVAQLETLKIETGATAHLPMAI